MSIDSGHNKAVYAKLVARAWVDDAFKQQLLRDPKQVALDHGMSLPDDAVVTVSTAGSGFSVDTSGAQPSIVLTLPPRPADLTDEVIDEWGSSGASWNPAGQCSSSQTPTDS